MAAKSKETTLRKDSRLQFAKALQQWREEKGFESAWAFFHKSGGKKAFGFAYNTYMRIENGSRLPSKDALERVMSQLGSALGYKEQRRGLMSLFLRALVGGDPMFDPVFDGTPSSAPEREEDPNDEVLKVAAKRAFDAIPTMSPEQMEAMQSSDEALWSHQYLLSTGQEKTLPELAQILGLKPDRLRPALDLLVSRKLVELGRQSRYSSPHFKTGLLKPRVETVQSWISQQSRIRARTPDNAAGKHSYVGLMIPADPKAAATIINLFREAMFRAHLLRPSAPVRAGEWISVEYSVFRMMTIRD